MKISNCPAGVLRLSQLEPAAPISSNRLWSNNDSSAATTLKTIYSLMRAPRPEFCVCAFMREAPFRRPEELMTGESIVAGPGAAARQL